MITAGLIQLIKGLDQIAGLELQSRVNERVEEVALRTVLDHLRIVIEPDWRELDGVIRWNLPSEIPVVVADPSGLLQAFLNLARNSHRAVEQCFSRELSITVSADQRKACVRFQEFEPGVLYFARVLVSAVPTRRRWERSRALCIPRRRQKLWRGVAL